jgi:two-component system sensor histidine kinase ChvG
MLTRDVDRLERLVSGVHELARIDARLGHEETAPVDLAAFVADFVAGRRLTTPCPIELDVGKKHEGYRVRVSPERLGQVLENLVSNATSFAPPGTAVTVSLARHDGWCAVSVTDRGPGIPAEHLERVFDRFFTYRPDGTGRGKDHAGLGLAIARAIVEGYGGSLAAANAAGGGASFEVRLPSVTAVAPEPGASEAPSRYVHARRDADPPVPRVPGAGGRTDYRSREIS